ncbi:MAG TPA: hypothetical protein VGN63_13705 [Flavisolibacter sp.]|jgi:hypothetical protein|nr:hypothetical protein [Flavisolibacter sp.]
MKLSILLINPKLQIGVKRYSTNLLSGVFLLFVLLFAGTAFAQTVTNHNLNCDISNRNPCTSKDLEVVSVFIDGANCQGCQTGSTVTYPLKMTIHNGTKSTRTSFSLYGTLSSGASINGKSGNIFICVGEITVKSDELLDGEDAPGNQTFAVGTITFECGQDLTLSNNFLAWTDASGETVPRCGIYAAATKCSDIAPKCGTATSITIVGPLGPPTLEKVDPTCTLSTGTIRVTSATAGLKFSLDGGDFTDYPPGGWSGLSSGEHCVRAQNADCTSEPACKTIGGAPANPDRPVVTLQEASICGTLTTPTVTVSCPVNGIYKLTQPGEQLQQKTYTGSESLVFPVKPGIGFSITVTTDGCISDPTNCDNYDENSCPGASVAKPGNIQEQNITLQKKSLPTVNTAPNPFNDRIRFTLKSEVSGRGSLEVYNTLGQRVKTVFQGQVTAGQVQTVEYAVPVQQRSNLIYIFRVGNEQTTGKLIGPK